MKPLTGAPRAKKPSDAKTLATLITPTGLSAQNQTPSMLKRQPCECYTSGEIEALLRERRSLALVTRFLSGPWWENPENPHPDRLPKRGASVRMYRVRLSR